MMNINCQRVIETCAGNVGGNPHLVAKPILKN